MNTWSAVYERTDTGWSAYVPALPGVGVAGTTRDETERLTAEAIVLHLEGLAEGGMAIPEPDVAVVGRVEPSLPA